MLPDECEELLDVLPLSTVDYAFAYGSAAFQQKGENKTDKMVDFILSTSDPVSFHSENIAKNPSHYSLLRCIGAKSLAKFQTRLAARVYYNTHVNVGRRKMKYGVVATEDLNRDLLDWRWLYVSGRLQKPVLDVVRPTSTIKTNMEENRRSALQAALLLLPDSFSLEELYQKLVSLSYMGDFRMFVGEDKDKVRKIVQGSMEELWNVYEPFLANDSRLVVQNEKVLQDGSTAAILHRLNLLPSTVLNAIQKNWNKRNKWQKDTEEVLFSLAHRHDVTLHVEGAIASIVAPAAMSQTLKNAASAGFSRSVLYGIAKLTKMVKSLVNFAVKGRMGLKKWMSAVKSGQDGSKMMSRKQNRKQAKRLRKLQSVACARHQPIEKIMEEAFRSKIESKSKTKKRKRKIKQMEAELKANEEGHDEEESKSKRRRKQRGGDSSSESDSDADLTYDQYMKEVQDKKRKIALDDDAAKQDNIDIHKYSKLLGIKELKNGKKPKSFVYDGLDDLLEFCDTDDRRKLLATSTDQEIVLKGDDLDEGEEEDEVEEDIDETEDLDDEDIDELAVDDEEGDDDNADGDSQAGVSEDDDASEDNKSENGEEEEYKEDIYGRKVSKKTGEVVTFDIRGAHKKLEDLDAKGGDNESRVQIERVLMGTLNRLSEGTLVRSHQVVSETWQKNSKNDVKASLTRILCRLIGAPYRMQDHLLSLYAMFMAHIHTFTSEEISAYFVEVFLRDFVEEISKPLTQDDKKLENSVVFIAHMLNFHMIKATVVLEVFEKLREKLNVDNLQLIVTLATYSYKVFRKLHWIPFSEELAKISTDLETAVFAALPRAKFLGENLSSLQKSPPTNVDMSVIEHHLKVFQGLRKKNKASSDKELGMSLDDLLHADERGRWWVVGSAYRVGNEGGAVSASAVSSQGISSFPEDIVQLARRAKMNTEVRRNIFCTVATSDDEDSAFEKLLRLSLKGQQEREIIYVLIVMLLKEKTFNAFYPMLIARFCEFDKRFALTTQYALWDRIREVDSLKLRARTRLADLIHHLIANEVLPITILKVVEWGTLTAGVSSVIRRVFKLLSSSSLTKVRRVFTPLLAKEKNPLLSEGLRLFLSVNFPDSEVYTKLEESFLAD